MTQLVITLKDQSYLPNIRRIVKSLQGVESVSMPRKPLPTRRKPVAAVRKSSSTLWESLAADKAADPLEALESIGSLVRSTGRTSRQLIDEYLEEKYGV